MSLSDNIKAKLEFRLAIYITIITILIWGLYITNNIDGNIYEYVISLFVVYISISINQILFSLALDGEIDSQIIAKGNVK
jgi:hypothetical protein